MYLKSLTLKGFKSSADKTSMLFDPGLTVVVGPNGSGKSNVSDAILWVLGEQSARQLRGQAMEDVIFSGSSARQPQGLAEVTLVLDNTDHTLPVDFSEVAITRRMYRSGESEYLINGAPSRLMDIQDILHDSGLGKDTHSIISQGKLDSVLSSKPEDRRSLIEEAADISKHRRRKQRSERKLAAMDENLARAKVIAREISRQLRPLERQVDRASKAHDIQEELSELTTLIAVDDLRMLQREGERLETRRKEAEAAIEVSQYRKDEKTKELEKLQSLLEQKGLFVGDLGEQRRRVADVLGRLDSDMRLIEERERNMVSRANDARSLLGSLKRRLSDSAAELERLEGELSDAAVSCDDLSSRLGASEEAEAAARAAREKADAEASALIAEERAAREKADASTLAYAKLEDQLSSAELEDSMFASRLEQIDEAAASARETIARRNDRKEEVGSALEAARAEQDASEEAIRASEEELASAREAERSAREKLSAATATLEALSAVATELESASPLVAALAVHEGAKDLVECRLSDLIEADERAEGIIARLLGDDLIALVAAGSGQAVELAQAAARLDVGEGEATLVYKGAGGLPERAGAPGEALTEHIRIEKGAEALIGALLGDVRMVESIAAAVEAHTSAPSFTYVTPEGAAVLPDGRIRIGSARSDSSGLLERKRRIHALEKGMADLEKGAEASAAGALAAEERLSGAQAAQLDAKSRIASLTAELSSLDSELGRLESQLSQAESEGALIARKRDESQERAAEARTRIEELRADARASRERADAIAAKIEQATAARDETRSAETAAASALAEIRLELAMANERKNHIEQRVSELGGSTRSLSKRIEETGFNLRRLDYVLTRAEPLKERYAALHERAVEWAARLADSASLAEADSDSLKKTIAEARGAVFEATGDLEVARSTSQDIRVEMGRLEVQVENAVAKITATGAVLEEALELPEPEDRELAERTIAKLQRALEDIGPINEVAMEEYTKLKERADFIDEQVRDLEAARGSLKKITSAIERKMRTRFLVVFEKVNENFSEIFSVLFPGGQAHLELTDPDNLFETGLEIVAQPRGKRLSKMMLMSGGEKSLTALALLFAVYRARTVPFYVFDEVEAALDDSNLGKLLDAIDQLKESTQLIVISHQRRTMETADVLYGVSMQADGVSRVVSQRLERRPERWSMPDGPVRQPESGPLALA